MSVLFNPFLEHTSYFTYLWQCRSHVG